MARLSRAIGPGSSPAVWIEVAPDRRSSSASARSTCSRVVNPAPRALLQAVKHLHGDQHRQPAQADLPAHRDR